MEVGYGPFLFFYILGNLFISSPFGQAWRKGRSPQSHRIWPAFMLRAV